MLLPTIPAIFQVLLLASTFSLTNTQDIDPAPADISALSVHEGWRWPLSREPQVLKEFDKPEQQWSAGHRGIDLDATQDDEVVAPNRGRITFASTVVDRPVLVIDHGYGFKSSIEPVSLDLEVGAWVEAGAHIGTVASGAHCDARCIHWGVRLDGEYIDPALLIEDLRPSILLPWND